MIYTLLKILPSRFILPSPSPPPCSGLPVWVMSTQAYEALTPDQRDRLARHVAAIHHAPIDTLERIGGGGVRCTLAELF